MRDLCATLTAVGIALAGCGGTPIPPATAPSAPSGDATTQGAPVAAARHRVVFEMTTDDHDQWQSVLNNVDNIRKALGPDKTDVEVVAHGSGLSMLLATNTADRARMEELSHAGVVFAACENTMKKKHVAKEDLLPFAMTVDSGVGELVRKQEAGWAYLKSSK